MKTTRLNRWVAELNEAAIRCARYSDSDLVFFGWLAWLHPLATVADQLVANPTFGTFFVRVFAAFLFLPFVFHKRLPRKIKVHFHLYFVFAVTYAFPFAFGFMLAMNAGTTPSGSESHMFWILQYFISLFLFLQLIIDGRLATLTWTLASLAALLPLSLLADVNIEELQRVFVYPITGYLTALLIGVATNRRTDIIYAEKAAAASAIGANLAHELRTPLASIGAIAKGAPRLFPVLTDAYRDAKKAGIPVKPLRDSQLEQLDEVFRTIGNEVDYSNTIIDMLLLNTSDKLISDREQEIFEVNAVIAESIRRYPFNNEREKQLIEIEESASFELIGHRLLLVHVLFNLIKNSLYFVQRARSGSIRISTSLEGASGKVIVHDTGTGIPSHIRQHIFDRFFTTTTTGQGAGIGLSFCRLVVESMNGKIDCESKEGEYTTFILSFPNVLNQKQYSRSKPIPANQLADT